MVRQSSRLSERDSASAIEDFLNGTSSVRFVSILHLHSSTQLPHCILFTDSPTQFFRSASLPLYECRKLQMTAGPMRRLSSSSRTHAQRITLKNLASSTPVALRQPQRTLANIRERDISLSKTWFTSTVPRISPPELRGQDHSPPDERTLKLGKSKYLCLGSYFMY